MIAFIVAIFTVVTVYLFWRIIEGTFQRMNHAIFRENYLNILNMISEKGISKKKFDTICLAIEKLEFNDSEEKSVDYMIERFQSKYKKYIKVKPDIYRVRIDNKIKLLQADLNEINLRLESKMPKREYYELTDKQTVIQKEIDLLTELL